MTMPRWQVWLAKDETRLAQVSFRDGTWTVVLLIMGHVVSRAEQAHLQEAGRLAVEELS